MNPFYKSLEVIWENPKFVFLNEKRLKEVAKEIAKEDLKIPDWRAPVYYPDDDERFVQFIGIQNSINFAFTDFKTKKKFKITDWRPKFKGQEWVGAFGMVGSLLRAIEDGFNILDANYLRSISKDVMEHIFRSIPGYPMPMLKERTQIFQEIGQVLLDEYDGSFWNLFRDAGFRAFGPYGVVNQLRHNFSSFNDVSEYLIWPMDGAHDLHFHKRSQLMVMIYQGRALDSRGKLPLISDIDDLGAIADYQIPRIMEFFGIIEYDSLLQDKILREEIILQDSLEEQEIRAMTVLAMKRLVEEINKIREKLGKDKINICHLDYKFWHMGRSKEIKTPHHLTPTIFY